MSTSKSYITFIQDCVEHISGTRVKAMFGEYALYYDSKVVGLICDDIFFIKITPGSTNILGENCETGAPYPGAKLQYVVPEEILENRDEIRTLIISVADQIPTPKKKKK